MNAKRSIRLSGCALCLLLAVALAGAARADMTVWQCNPAAPGDWFDPANWTEQVPSSGDDAVVDNDGEARIGTGGAEALNLYVGLSAGQSGTVHQTAGTNNLGDFLIVGGESGSSGRYYLDATGELSAKRESIGNEGTGDFCHRGGTHTVSSQLVLGAALGSQATYTLYYGELSVPYYEYIGSEGSATFSQSGGTHTVGFSLTLGAASGSYGAYELQQGGELSTHIVYIGDGGTGEFTQTGGTHTVASKLCLGYFGGSQGSYTISAGSLSVKDFYIGMSGIGSLDLAGAFAPVTVSGKLRFGPLSSLSAVEGSAIHMTGADLENVNTDPLALAGLGNLELIFEGGAEAIDALEAAGEDMGAVTAGWTDNFALGTLTLGEANAGRIRLVDNSDNQPGWEGAEAVYVDGLALNPGATIDLNGLKLYYLNGGPPKQFFCGDVNLDGAVDGGDYNLWADHYLLGGMSWGEGDLNGDGIVDGGDFTLWADDYGSATVAAIPEPAALALLAIGAVALIRRRHR